MRTLLSYLISAGIPEPKAQRLLETSWVRVDGEVISNPEALIDDTSRVVLYEPKEV